MLSLTHSLLSYFDFPFFVFLLSALEGKSHTFRISNVYLKCQQFKMSSLSCRLLLFVLILLNKLLVSGRPHNHNISISVPDGTTQHGDPHLVCPPSRWYDIALFYLVNYASHAVTVTAVPGEKILSVVFNIVAAFLFPYSGILRVIEAIVRHDMLFCHDDLKELFIPARCASSYARMTAAQRLVNRSTA